MSKQEVVPVVPQGPTCVVLIALGCAGQQLGHGGAHSLGGTAQVLGTLLQLVD